MSIEDLEDDDETCCLDCLYFSSMGVNDQKGSVAAIHGFCCVSTEGARHVPDALACECDWWVDAEEDDPGRDGPATGSEADTDLERDSECRK